MAVSFVQSLHQAGDDIGAIEGAELRKDFRKFRDELIALGALEGYREGRKVVGYMIGVGALPKVERAVCSLDPFSYISHLSAMDWHGLTDRMPKTIFLTSPSKALWRTLSNARLEHSLGALLSVYQDAKLPAYHRLNMDKFRKRPLSVWSSSRLDQAYQAAYKRVENGEVRVATVGRCFLDMVREPDRCGGIYHVIEVFDEHAGSYSEQILSELHTHGNKLEQARVGYLLEQANPGLKGHPILEQWASEVTRGGSRKLDPAGDYSDEFSRRWALSINV
ncbi:putative transcriptional regulator of viral defense system [Natronospira proteinivora]|uniref:Transcriptional regulator of viral defense system n=1 Tax=Natronospira proteinivora TaxID=1807133 RepID=A0ABT1GAH5_9GAMM|nr:type IV toxin-antitoxin system AbiEi family antitoxin [Natronospira proteinivora]MCP1727253.1 putative transcriptional regulator of viral defense system [Natronospira proteinivora]